jgi:Phosphotransferase enzyme family
VETIIDRVTRLHHEGVAAQHKAINRSDIPATYSAITTDWLTDVLCRDLPDARVTSFSLDGEDEGTTSRRRIFLRYNDIGDNSGLPASVFCKCSQSLESKLSLGIIGATRAENAFYKHVRQRIDIEAPTAFWTNHNLESFASVLVLRDLGPTAQFCNEHTDMNWERAVSMVLLLAKLHSRFYEDKDLGSAALPFTTLPELFSLTRTLGMDESSAVGFLAAESVIPRRLFLRHAEIPGAMVRSMESQKALPRTLLHSDCHLKNWYLADDVAMGLADWQIVSVGHWAHDIAYAICCGLTVENRRAWERELLAIYVNEISARGVPPVSFDAAWNLYRQQLFFALRFWTVTLKPSAMLSQAMHAESSTLVFIQRITCAMDDLDSLDSFV